MKSQEIYSHRMDQFGSVNEEDSSTVERLRDQRIKRGECPTCQRKTHKISRFRGKREPLTIEGEVVDGICLHCNPLTEWGRRDKERGQPSKMSRLVEEEDDDEDEKWKKQQRRQKFHPMSMYLFNSSELSLGIESTDGSENSSEHFRPPTLHPLSKHIHNSERSLPLATNESEISDPNKFEESANSLLSSESGYSSDGQRIKSLLQGSQSIKTKVCENLTLPKSHNQGGKDDSLQQKRDHQHIKSDSFKPSPVKPASSENRRPNRFSLRQVEQNRFSLTLKDLPRAKLRASDPTDYNYEMELDNSRNWDSADILRDAAAEANGEKFSLDDFIKEMEAEKEQLANSKQRPDDNLPHVAATETTSSTDKLEAMFSSLSLPPSPADEAKMTKTKKKRKGRKPKPKKK